VMIKRCFVCAYFPTSSHFYRALLICNLAFVGMRLKLDRMGFVMKQIKAACIVSMQRPGAHDAPT
jgi:hypothetical protein